MKAFILFIIITAGFNHLCDAQAIVVNSDISLPADSVVKKQLISSLNDLLILKEGPDKDNTSVLPGNQLQTWALLDEMRGMEKNTRLKDDNFYKCYLTNAVKLGDKDYSIQLSYIGITDNKPVLRASFKLLAMLQDGRFYFSSPLKQYTQHWKTMQLGFLTYHYKDTINIRGAKAYLKTVEFYDGKLKAPASQITVYYCDNFTEAELLLGMEYKADYSGIANGSLSAHNDNALFSVNGEKADPYRFDAHDLWHERLRTVLSADIINRPVDEGCAYLYGGSWGLTWLQIWTKFKKYATENPKADWLALYLSGENFVPGPKILKISYVLNALIAQQIEKERGFPGVLTLLACGKKQTGDENYFTALEKSTGIHKADFNATMWKLINTR